MSSMFRDVIVKMMQSITLDENNNIEVVDEQLKEEADELLGQLVIETARQWWVECENQEDSLAGMEDEISADEKMGGRDSLRTPALGKKKKEQTVEALLGMEEFDVASILEMDDEDEASDGDTDYDDLLRGDDEDMGGENHFDDMDDSDDMDSLGDEHADMDDEEKKFDDFADEDQDDSEFDFSFLSDEDDDMDMDDDFVMHGDDTDMDMDMPKEDEPKEQDDYDEFEDGE